MKFNNKIDIIRELESKNRFLEFYTQYNNKSEVKRLEKEIDHLKGLLYEFY